MKTLIPPSLVVGALLLPFATASELKPSRLIEADQLSQHLAEANTRLSIGERQFDPFGQIQDTEAKLPEPAKPIQGVRGPVQGVRFADVVNRIPVAAVAPQQKRALIADQFYGVGEVFPVRFKGRNFEVELKHVAADAVDFRNTKTNEVATRALRLKAAPLEKNELPNNFGPQQALDLN